MTLEEAIRHCKEEAEKLRKDSVKRLQIGLMHAANDCEECAAEHEQLAEWLEELKQRREEGSIVRCGECRYMEPNGHCTQFADDHIRPSVSDFCSAGERRKAVTEDAGSKID